MKFVPSPVLKSTENGELLCQCFSIPGIPLQPISPRSSSPTQLAFEIVQKVWESEKKFKRSTQSSLAEKLPPEKLLFPVAMVEMGVCLVLANPIPYDESCDPLWAGGALAFGYCWVPKSFYYSKLWNFAWSQSITIDYKVTTLSEFFFDGLSCCHDFQSSWAFLLEKRHCVLLLCVLFISITVQLL